MRRLLFFGDHMADPLWEVPSEAMVDADTLPISDDLRRSVREWARKWECVVGQQMQAEDRLTRTPGVEDQPVTAAQWNELDAAGRLVWQRLRLELGDGWRVGWAEFRGLPERHVQWEPDGPVEPFPPVSGGSGSP